MDDPIERQLGSVDPAVDFPVIAIGASAGGLEAVTEMMRVVPAESGMAFVLVQHLDPNHDSMLAELLSKKASLRVRQIEDGETIERDTLSIIPPGKSLSVEDGRLALSEFDKPRGLRRPIDSFFASLARAQGELCACVVLSGTGADGTSGLRAVKDHGGVGVAQRLDEARYDGMPSSAIATGLIDYTLPADSIYSELKDYFERTDRYHLDTVEAEVSDNIVEICDALREIVGHDFSGYKRSTMIRRIKRRMQILKLETGEEYLAHLRKESDECEALFKDLLINVTSFFRDAQYFEVLRERAIEPLVQGAAANDEIRVWVPGCSTGQEAYTIAMLFDEACRSLERRPLIQIFATDIHDAVIVTAREGRFSSNALAEIPERFHEQLTVDAEGHMQVSSRIRDMIRFSVHSLIKDPPFTKLDLVSCRNLLIYFGEDVQRQVLPLIHFSLRSGGYLLLGPSESPSRQEELFMPVVERARLYRKRDVTSRYPLQLPYAARSTARRNQSRPDENAGAAVPAKSVSAAAMVMERFSPPFVEVDGEGMVQSSSGDLAAFLEARPGSDALHISAIARPGLREVVSSLVTQVRSLGERRAAREVEIASSYGTQPADVVADPLPNGNIALVFIASAAFRQQLDPYYTQAGDRDELVANLEEELRQVRHRLKSTVEELETANEELKSSNEEMMSMNEELQSANEELTTANDELKSKVDELNVAYDDLDNFLHSARVPIVVIDLDQRIRMFTEQANQIFPLQPGDHGRPFADLTKQIEGSDVEAVIANCLKTGETHESVVEVGPQNRVYLMRVQSYLSRDGSRNGCTLIFSDITQIQALETGLRHSEERMRFATGAAGVSVFEYIVEDNEAMLDDRGRELFSLENVEKPRLEDLLDRVLEDDRQVVEQNFQATVSDGAEYEAEFRVLKRDGSTRWIRAQGRRFEMPDQSQRVFGLNYDVSREREDKEQQQLLINEMNHRVKNLFAVISSLVAISSRKDEGVRDFANDLRERITSLGRAYELTRQSDYVKAVELAELLNALTEPFGRKGQIDIDSCKAAVPIKNITPLSLVIHELATNAVKYGGLSDHGDGVAIRASKLDDERVEVVWTEKTADFDPVAAENSPHFGTKLIERASIQLGEPVTREYAEDGLIVRLVLANA